MNRVQMLEERVSSWPDISVHPHRFGGREFRFRSAEVGHAHENGTVDIPFPRSIRDHLLAERLAEEHHWVPNSGWVTFHMRDEDDLRHAVQLMRLSYLRYALKFASNPHELLDRESLELCLSGELRSLLLPLFRRTLELASP